MIPRRRGTGTREPDVPEYLVDDCLIGDDGDDPHRAAAPRAEQRIFQPDHPDEPSPADTPAPEPLALIAIGAVRLAYMRTEPDSGHPALPRRSRCRIAGPYLKYLTFSRTSGKMKQNMYLLG
jgi:hypothetical protein